MQKSTLELKARILILAFQKDMSGISRRIIACDPKILEIHSPIHQYHLLCASLCVDTLPCGTVLEREDVAKDPAGCRSSGLGNDDFACILQKPLFHWCGDSYRIAKGIENLAQHRGVSQTSVSPRLGCLEQVRIVATCDHRGYPWIASCTMLHSLECRS